MSHTQTLFDHLVQLLMRCISCKMCWLFVRQQILKLQRYVCCKLGVQDADMRYGTPMIKAAAHMQAGAGDCQVSRYHTTRTAAAGHDSQYGDSKELLQKGIDSIEHGLHQLKSSLQVRFPLPSPPACASSLSEKSFSLSLDLARKHLLGCAQAGHDGATGGDSAGATPDHASLPR